jgi:hypothetical protein
MIKEATGFITLDGKFHATKNEAEKYLKDNILEILFNEMASRKVVGAEGREVVYFERAKSERYFLKNFNEIIESLQTVNRLRTAKPTEGKAI